MGNISFFFWGGGGGGLLYSQASIGLTEGMVMMSKARSTELWIFSGAGILVLGCGRDIVKMLCFFRERFFSTPGHGSDGLRV